MVILHAWMHAGLDQLLKNLETVKEPATSNYKEFLFYQVMKTKRIKIACKNTFNVLPYEGIVHDVAVICFQNLLKFRDVVILIGTAQNPRDWLIIFKS